MILSLGVSSFLMSNSTSAAFMCPNIGAAVIVEKSHYIQPTGQNYSGQYVYGNHKLYLCENGSLIFETSVVVGPRSGNIVPATSSEYGRFKTPTPNYNGLPAIRGMQDDGIVLGPLGICSGVSSNNCIHDSTNDVTDPSRNVSHGCVRVPNRKVRDLIIPTLDKHSGSQVLIIRDKSNAPISTNTQPQPSTNSNSNNTSSSNPVSPASGGRSPINNSCPYDKQKLQSEINRIRANPQYYANPDGQIREREAKIRSCT